MVVEAIQFDENSNKGEIEDFVGEKFLSEIESETAYIAGQGPPIFSLKISTLEGDMKISPGDWVIRGVNGEFYPCKPDIFAKTYDTAE